MAKSINPGMFTKANASVFWSRVNQPDRNGCLIWNGPKAHYRGRKFGIFRVAGCGYVMNQRFVYITQNALPEREHGIKVRPAADCQGRELCCNPLHIVELRNKK